MRLYLVQCSLLRAVKKYGLGLELGLRLDLVYG